MAAFDFPSSPNVNDIYTLNGVAFMWNGSVWKRYSTSTGAQGFQGAAGAAGAQGAQGTAGVLGGDGAQGAVGAQGATGNAGSTGAQGAAGAAGAQGAAGAAGAQGAPFDRSEYNYTASGGQTAFAAAYANASDVDVFMNGVRLTPAEYTASGGTTITLTSGATAGDIIDILTFASAGPTGAQGSQGHQGDAFNRSESNFTATSGQTSFAPSGGYTNGDDLDVFVNGVRLTPADYTASNGTNVVLDVGANTGDIVDIIYYEAAGPAGAQGSAGIAGTVTFSTGAPSNPLNGDLWYDTDDGAFAGYYDDGSTSQWIDLSGGPRGAQGADGAQGAAGSIPSNITAVNGTFSGNVSIAGTLTYEDVTNIDAVGVITARAGIDVTGGQVGIGTDVPDASLHIHRDDVTSYPAIWMSGSTKRKNVIKVNNSDNLIISVDEDDEGSDSNFRLQIDGSEKLRVTANGSIGIGTATPGDGTLVDVIQEFGRTRISKYGHIISQNTLASTTEYWTLAPRNGGAFEIGRGTPDSNGTVADVKFSMQAGGSVTIGGAYSSAGGFDTTNARFSVGNDTANAANFIRIGKRVGTTETNLPYITHGSFEGDGNDLILGAHSADGRIRFYTGASNSMPLDGSNLERMCITQNGRIGINETSPNGSLHIGNLPTGSGNVNVVTLDRDDGTLIYGIDYNGSSNLVSFTGNNKQFAFANKSGAAEAVRILPSGGITFNGDTAAANALDDYEEGELGWRLQRSNAIGSGSNHSDTSIRYTKVGNRVYVSGYLYTTNTGNSTNVNVELRDNSNTNNLATLPYVPNQAGGFSITGTRTIDDNYRNMAVTFRHGQAQVYIYKDDGDNDYLKNKNNVQIANSTQTHLVIQFCGSYTTSS